VPADARAYASDHAASTIAVRVRIRIDDDQPFENLLETYA
jgi:hypothetical protein